MPKAQAASRSVPYVNFPAQFAEEHAEILACVEAVFSRGEFIGGAEIDQLEAELAALCGSKHAVVLNSGTDALILAMKVLGVEPGDEVITPPNSFIASAASIALIGARPVFADVKPDQNIDPAAIEAAITPRTVAIMPVHLTGRMADMTAIRAIARRHGLLVIEDAAQAICSRVDGMTAGSAGDVGCFSLHPLKNLNAAGDAGFITLNDDEQAARLKRLRNHGFINRETSLEFGYVSRLDTLQAAILRDQTAFNAATVGKTCTVLLDRPGRQPGQQVGKSPWLQSVHLNTDAAIGDLIEVEIVSAGPNSLGGVERVKAAA